MARRSNGEGTSPKQRKDGIWYRAIRIEGTKKRKYLYAKTKAELDKKYKEFSKQLASGTYVEVQKQTVESYMTCWLTTYKRVELKPKSYDRLECTIKYQVVPFFKDKYFFEIVHDDVQRFINKLDEEGYSYSVVRKAYLALNACYKYAMMKGDTIKNPCMGVKLPQKTAKGTKTIHTLTQDEIMIYCKYATAQYSNGKSIYRLGYALVFILFTGLRLGEAMGLMWDDIDFQGKTLTVRRTLEQIKNRDKGNNNNNYILVEGTTKTKSGKRTVALNQTAINALLELQKINGDFPYVLSNAAGKPVSPRNLNRTHDCILKRAGISHIGIHALRHTFASQLFANHVDIKIISKLLGHSDVTITYNTYIHLITEALPEATAILDNLLIS